MKEMVMVPKTPYAAHPVPFFIPLPLTLKVDFVKKFTFFWKRFPENSNAITG